MADFDLFGQVAVVTNAAGGIGEAIGRAFADAGAAVVLASRSVADVEPVASSIRSLGGRALAVRADVTDTFALGSLATAAVDEFGHLDIWVNNSSHVGVGATLAELRRCDWDQVVDLNFTAVWNASMAAVEQMHWGSIVNITSTAALGTVTGHGHYDACRAAVVSLTQTMAWELAPDIRVNAIAPGMIQTKLPSDTADTDHLEFDGPAARMPLGPGTPADVAAAALYLASPAAKWVTGQTLHVSGGTPIV